MIDELIQDPKKTDKFLSLFAKYRNELTNIVLLFCIFFLSREIKDLKEQYFSFIVNEHSKMIETENKTIILLTDIKTILNNNQKIEK